MRLLYVFATAFVLTACLTTTFAQTPQTPSDEHPKLPAGEGRDVMIRVCSQCHEPENVVDQQLTEKEWRDLVEDMASRGASASDEEIDQIVKYLATAFPPETK